MKTGIYGIKNIISNKIYIGKGKSISSRFASHKYALRNNKHVNPHLQNSWNKHTEENFNFFIIERCAIENLCEKEEYWINFFNSINDEFGFNLMKPGRENYSHSKETIEKMSRVKKGKKITEEHCENIKLSLYKPVLQYDLDGNFIKEWLGASQIRDVLGYNQSNITGVCNGLRKTHKKFIWKYKEKAN